MCQHALSPSSRGVDSFVPILRPLYIPTGSTLTHSYPLPGMGTHLYLASPEPHPKKLSAENKVRPQCKGISLDRAHGPGPHRYTTAGSNMLATSTLYSSLGGLSSVSGKGT